MSTGRNRSRIGRRRSSAPTLVLLTLTSVWADTIGGIIGGETIRGSLATIQRTSGKSQLRPLRSLSINGDGDAAATDGSTSRREIKKSNKIDITSKDAVGPNDLRPGKNAPDQQDKDPVKGEEAANDNHADSPCRDQISTFFYIDGFTNEMVRDATCANLSQFATEVDVERACDGYVLLKDGVALSSSFKVRVECPSKCGLCADQDGEWEDDSYDNFECIDSDSTFLYLDRSTVKLVGYTDCADLEKFGIDGDIRRACMGDVLVADGEALQNTPKVQELCHRTCELCTTRIRRMDADYQESGVGIETKGLRKTDIEAAIVPDRIETKNTNTTDGAEGVYKSCIDSSETINFFIDRGVLVKGETCSSLALGGMLGPFCEKVVATKWQNRNEIQESAIKYGVGVRADSKRDQGVVSTEIALVRDFCIFSCGACL